MDIYAVPGFFDSMRRINSLGNRLHRRWCNLKYGLENIWKWRKIVWRDRDWDHSFLLDLLEFKFRNMSELHEKYGHTLFAYRYAKQLKICALLARRIRDDNYQDIPMTRHEAKWGTGEMQFIPTGNGTSKMQTIHANVKTEADAKQEREEIRRIFKHAGKRRDYDLKFMTQIMGKYLLHWWD